MTFKKYPKPVNDIKRPCRAFGILAREAPIAAILRRGPSTWVQLIRWQTASDVIEYGQWFHGRIYERRCDLSPDGKLFLYFAQKKNNRTMADLDYTYAWTAVSKPPYFTALALWPKGDCWNGGGVFEDYHTLRLNHNPERIIAHPQHKPQGLTVIPDFQEKGEDFSVYSKILRRHDWERIEDGGPWQRGRFGQYKPIRPDVWRKSNPQHRLSLRMSIAGSQKSQYGDDLMLSYDVVDEQSNSTHPIEDTSWADWDQQGRLVFVSRGLLLGQEFMPKIKLARVIADLNPQLPSSVIAPDWAKEW